MKEISIDAQIKCLIRELGFRERVYPGWVAKGRMKQTDADVQIETMKAALETLRDVKSKNFSECNECGGMNGSHTNECVFRGQR